MKKSLWLYFEHCCALSEMCSGGGGGGGECFVTKTNVICHGHVLHQTFKMWHHGGGKVLRVKGEDKTRLYRAAVCCSSYHESTLSVDTVS